ncbi:MAG: ATP-binding protein [Desulfomonile tiedjei]|nr:ATP-binding protein [Desulfomonile tiedjei]
MAGRLQLSIQNNYEALARLMGEANEFLEDSAVPETVVYKANLILEELLTNIIKYAFDDEGVHEISVVLTLAGTTLTIEFVDGGREFSPLLAPQPEACHSILDCTIGGLGIHLVRTMTESVEYRREQEKNFFVARLKIDAE